MKFKKKENHNVDTLVLLSGGIKIFLGEDTETMFGAETEGKAIQSLSHLGVHPIYSSQT
jgi:predicted ATP-grasp superfamily ATP-dependent carboligase